ncbi:hypothetical protein pkur_cds_716 [Pandoravirus kuranda]|uniref:F-box incomplete domain containing protein n=1 Tax=Pandoravirus kuranda TaxID=3019033 RepID=A0AA95EF84_9VIRU|nr:hypothetical protein pkur_cds_716 [Pandoravirus kuranda]
MKRQGSWPLGDTSSLPEAQRRRVKALVPKETSADEPPPSPPPLDITGLPPEMIEMVLAAAGPFGAARAARASSALRNVGRDLAQRQSLASRARYCPDYWSCVVALTDAIGAHDADLVETILASGAISMTLPFLSPEATLPVPVPSDRGPRAMTLLSMEPPVRDGWTPLALSAFMGASSVVHRLASLGARPLPTAASLMSGILLRKFGAVPLRATLRGVGALIRAYPTTRPLAAIDVNPLTALRLYAVSRAEYIVASALIQIRGTVSPHTPKDPSEALTQTLVQCYSKGVETRSPAEREAAMVAARDLGARVGGDLFGRWLGPVLTALLSAGYDPRDRTLVAAIKTIKAQAGVSEVAAAATACENARAALKGDPALRRRTMPSTFVRCWGHAIKNHMEAAILGAFIEAYGAAIVAPSQDAKINQ